MGSQCGPQEKALGAATQETVGPISHTEQLEITAERNGHTPMGYYCPLSLVRFCPSSWVAFWCCCPEGDIRLVSSWLDNRAECPRRLGWGRVNKATVPCLGVVGTVLV